MEMQMMYENVLQILEDAEKYPYLVWVIYWQYQANK
jgi:hypothetical protein